MSSHTDRGFTLIELLIVVAVLGIVAALAVAGLLRAKMAANEASAIGSLRAINSAQQAYATSCANGFYASALPILHSAPSGATAFLPSDLGLAATMVKSGYVITLARGTDGIAAPASACNPLGTAGALASVYYATANPVSMTSGTRHFWTGTPGAIYVALAGPIDHTAGNTIPPAPAMPLEGQ